MTKLKHISNEQIISLANDASIVSIRQLTHSLGLTSGSAFAAIKERLKLLNLYDKFKDSKLWNKGKTSYTDKRIKSTLQDDKIFCIDSNASTGFVKKLILQSKLLVEECSMCHLNLWLDKKIMLELDHVNGVNSDNRIENLRFLCPNCHSTTDTWRGRNKNKVHEKVSDVELLKALKANSSIRSALLSCGLSLANNYRRCYKLLAKDKPQDTQR